MDEVLLKKIEQVKLLSKLGWKYLEFYTDLIVFLKKGKADFSLIENSVYVQIFPTTDRKHIAKQNRAHSKERLP